MASLSLGLVLSLFLLIIFPVAFSAEAPLTHHGGRLLTGNLNVGILWYGPIPRGQRKAILSFLRSLNGNAASQPQVSSWWKVVESYQSFAKTPARGLPRIPVKVVNQQFDPNYSLGKVLIKDFIKPLLPKATGGKPNTLALIIATKGVTVQDMCAGSCAQHGLIGDQPYVAVGDPEEECPECAWPFLKSPSKVGPTMKPPSGNVGADAMVMLLAGGLAGAVTNPYGDGFYATERGDALIEATTKCSGIFATGGKVLVNPTNSGAYNANGVGNAKFLLPAIWDPKSSSCWTPL
ncbi:Protein EXORDIUM-like [Sesbania bispinosa]|nr:Protein EXORDIUM-like [Sesbania bispinosa]